MPFWLSLLLNGVVRFLNEWLANKRAEQALRELGAAGQRETARREAEREEAIAEAAGKVAEAALDDPRDLRKD